ncbi:MarR family winged helix-turn-helix transcriptional regulator [Burkholderia sp. MR1-5-21]
MDVEVIALRIWVKDAYRGLSKALQTRLKFRDVMYGHWTFLRILWKTDGITQRQLSEQAGVMEPATFSALQSMEKLGYVSRRKMPGNPRVPHVEGHGAPARANPRRSPDRAYPDGRSASRRLGGIVRRHRLRRRCGGIQPVSRDWAVRFLLEPLQA